MLVEFNKIPNNSKKNKSTNDKTMLQEEVIVEINKIPNNSKKDELTNDDAILKE